MKLEPGRFGMSHGTWRAAVFLFVFAIVLGAGNLLFTAHEINAVRSAVASVTQLCESGNEFRSQQVVLWEHIIAISQPPPHETPAQKRMRLATVRAFDAYLHKVFAPRNCRARHH